MDSFVKPSREIMTIFDISKWYRSEAYQKYLDFVRRINDSVKGIPTTSNDIEVGECLQKIVKMLDTLDAFIDEYPPEDMGSQRFGNKSYKKWYEQMSLEIETLVKDILGVKPEASIELVPYLLDAFGNPTRIDYGSGHEACFLIFLFCLFHIGLLTSEDDKAVVLRVFDRYLRLVRRLQIVYRMEPAGSRGVHALDDFQFAPFIFGSSQLINNTARLIPDFYLRSEIVEQNQNENLFFSAIQFINETKTGPFYEHSNQLYNISAVQTWEKINEGMFKMYEGEVLKKFPVVQHFLFGSIFSIKERTGFDETAGAHVKMPGDSGLEKLAANRHPTSLAGIPE
uniref:Serine/threonine-protein phosphatase 2A activator n=1 Tax=Ditylenchus dipsaci TaxID=166011 RepID=A0A915DKT7_9BILA